MDKRGQFFLIAALLISGIAISFSTVYNSVYVERADTQVYDLSEELYSELQQTYDSGVVRGDKPEDIQKNLKTLADYYQIQNPDSTFIIYYGNEESVQRINTQGGTGSDSEVIQEQTTTPQSGAGTRGTASVESTTSTTSPQTSKKVKVKIRFRDAD